MDWQAIKKAYFIVTKPPCQIVYKKIELSSKSIFYCTYYKLICFIHFFCLRNSELVTEQKESFFQAILPFKPSDVVPLVLEYIADIQHDSSLPNTTDTVYKGCAVILLKMFPDGFNNAVAAYESDILVNSGNRRKTFGNTRLALISLTYGDRSLKLCLKYCAAYWLCILTV